MTLHQKIDDALSHNPNGWCSPSKAHILASCVESMGGGTVCEIGIFCGRSFLPMALAVMGCGSGVAIGIDPFDGKICGEGEDEKHANWWERVPFERVEEIFMENMAECEVSAFVQIIKKRSEDVTPPQNITVLHVDGQHQDKALVDVARYSANVILGGFVILDDIHWEGGKVEKSVEILLHSGFVERRRVVGPEKGTAFNNDFAVFQRIGFC